MMNLLALEQLVNAADMQVSYTQMLIYEAANERAGIEDIEDGREDAQYQLDAIAYALGAALEPIRATVKRLHGAAMKGW
jgi:hypothetical protein